MAITEWVEKLGRVVFEAPFTPLEGGRDIPELAEIRLALVDEVKARSHRVSGRQVFPYNRIGVRLRGVSAEQAAMSSGFLAAFCERELRDALTRARYRFPDDLHVHIETTPDLPIGEQRWLSVTVESQPQTTPARRSGRLMVVRGEANTGEIALTKARTNIGRTVEIYRSDGPSRRNDLAFNDGGELGRTVSREHAHITYSKATAEYRLFNDRTAASDKTCGLWIIRDGLSRAVQRDSRGVKLQHGDEIHLGRAVLRFVLK